MYEYLTSKMTEADLRGLVDLFLVPMPGDPETRTLWLTSEMEEDLWENPGLGDCDPIDTGVIRISRHGVPYCVCTSSAGTFYLYFDEERYVLRACVTDDPDEAFKPDPEIGTPNVRAHMAAMSAYANHRDRKPDAPLAPNGVPLYADRDIAVRLSENGLCWRPDIRKACYDGIKAGMAGMTDADIHWLAFASACLFDDNSYTTAASGAIDALEAAGKLPSGDPMDCSDVFLCDFFADPEAAWPEYAEEQAG